jgi:hypothetical protein
MATTVTAAHHSIWRHLCDSMHAAPKPKNKLKFVTLDKESNMSTLRRREEFLRSCSMDELAEGAQDIEVTILVKKSQEAKYNLDPGSFFVNCFWGRRPDGITTNEDLQIVYTASWYYVRMLVKIDAFCIGSKKQDFTSQNKPLAFKQFLSMNYMGFGHFIFELIT